MKKRWWIFLIATVAVIAVLVVPIPQAAYDDGGTREYTALTYKIVDWNRLTADSVYDKTRVYFGADRGKSIDELWELEYDNVEHTFIATVLDISGTSVLVAPIDSEEESRSAGQISFGTKALGDIGAQTGSVVEITYTGGIMESYPAQINAVRWKIADTLRHMDFTEQWLDKETATVYDHPIFDHIVITKIYADCFFARTVIPMPYEIKLNGTLTEDWCVGDQITCEYENTYYDEESNRVEADMLSVTASDWQPDPNAAYKPVIYLYPEVETTVAATLTLQGDLTCTYPAYGDGWTVTAAPDGTLTDAQGQTYNYLYWEGTLDTRFTIEEGFCVKGEDTALFLEEALAELGLNRREANEFIVYWLPLMEQNPYNLIAFQTDAYTKAAALDITPAPDTVIRVFMTWHATEVPITLPAQELTAPERRGFTVVEWGGTELT